MIRDEFGRFKSGPMPQETKEKISNTMKGKIPANIKIFQAASKKANTGMKHTLETRRKMSIAHRGENIYGKGVLVKNIKKVI